MITTDKTAAAGINTLNAEFSRYRLMNYFIDLLKNLFSDPENWRDERLHSMLQSYDLSPDGVGRLVVPGGPYSEDTRESGTTPAIRVAPQGLNRSEALSTIGFQPINTAAGWVPMGGQTQLITAPIGITLVTENYPEHILLGDLLLEYFILNANNIANDCGIIDSLFVAGISEAQEMPIGTGGNAKNCFQSVISLVVTSNYNAIVDTQGPVFRGVNTTLRVE